MDNSGIGMELNEHPLDIPYLIGYNAYRKGENIGGFV